MHTQTGWLSLEQRGVFGARWRVCRVKLHGSHLVLSPTTTSTTANPSSEEISINVIGSDISSTKTERAGKHAFRISFPPGILTADREHKLILGADNDDVRKIWMKALTNAAKVDRVRKAGWLVQDEGVEAGTSATSISGGGGGGGGVNKNNSRSSVGGSDDGEDSTTWARRWYVLCSGAILKFENSSTDAEILQVVHLTSQSSVRVLTIVETNIHRWELRWPTGFMILGATSAALVGEWTSAVMSEVLELPSTIAAAKKGGRGRSHTSPGSLENAAAVVAAVELSSSPAIAMNAKQPIPEEEEDGEDEKERGGAEKDRKEEKFERVTAASLSQEMKTKGENGGGGGGGMRAGRQRSSTSAAVLLSSPLNFNNNGNSTATVISPSALASRKGSDNGSSLNISSEKLKTTRKEKAEDVDNNGNNFGGVALTSVAENDAESTDDREPVSRYSLTQPKIVVTPPKPEERVDLIKLQRDFDAVRRVLTGEVLRKLTKGGRGKSHTRFIQATAGGELKWGFRKGKILSVSTSISSAMDSLAAAPSADKLKRSFAIKVVYSTPLGKSTRDIILKAPTVEIAELWVQGLLSLAAKSKPESRPLQRSVMALLPFVSSFSKKQQTVSEQDATVIAVL